jgi:hypothetical protein
MILRANSLYDLEIEAFPTPFMEFIPFISPRPHDAPEHDRGKPPKHKRYYSQKTAFNVKINTRKVLKLGDPLIVRK